MYSVGRTRNQSESPEIQQQEAANGQSTTRPSNDTDQSQSSEEEEDDEDRPNRFHGPGSTWHYYTQEERGLAASLEQQQANDLSIHLYNTHALKARLRRTSPNTDLKAWHGKERWIQAEGGGKQPWYPKQQWTAWPLKPEDVPRPEEPFGCDPEDEDDGTYRKQEAWKPSQDLEGELHAAMLRRVKEQWEARAWASVPEEGVERTAKRRNMARSVSRNPLLTSRRSDGLSSGFSTRDAAIQDETKATGREWNGDEREERLSKPVLMADDEKAHLLLQPSVRHLLTMLDELLVGLHKSRVNHFQRGSHCSRSKAVSSASRSRSEGKSQPAVGRRLEHSKSHSRGSSVCLNENESAEDDAASDESSNNACPQANSKTRNVLQRNRLKTRDWSEVLGIAAITGWDQSIIDRAARRCAVLFGEGMTFQHLPETSASAPIPSPVQYLPDMVPPIEDLESADSDDSAVNEEYFSGYFCPHRDCVWYTKPHGKRWRFREHLKRAHNYSAEEMNELEHDSEQNRPDTPRGRNVRDWQPPDPLVCPHSGCNRPDKIWPETRRIIEHLRRHHGYDPRYESPLPCKGDTRDSGKITSSVSDDDYNVMVGGVHNDGFLRPIPAITGLRGTDKSKRLARSRTGQSQTRGRSPWARVLERREVKRQREVEGMDFGPEA